MKSIFLSNQRNRRHRQAQPEQQAEQEPFFSKPGMGNVQRKPKPFFQPKNNAAEEGKGVRVGKPGDHYEREADAVADAVVNRQSGQQPVVQRQPITPLSGSGGLQRLATPDEEKMPGTNDARMEEDKAIQQKPELQRQEMPKEEEKPVQTMGEEEEEPVQAKEEEEEPVQAMGEPGKEEEKPVQMMGEEEEEPVQAKEEEDEPVQAMGEPGKEEEKPVQMMGEEEEEPLQAKEEEEEPVQTKPQPGARPASADIGSKLGQRKGNGNALPKSVRSEMEHSFGVDFGGVNIHTDSEAVQMNRELHAQAFTHGQDVYFNSGKFNPENGEGKRLLAHELTHVVQQAGGNLKVQKDAEGTEHSLVEVNDRTKNKVSDAIKDDLNTAATKVQELTGVDIATGFGDTTREMSGKVTKAGADTFSWHKTGRAVDFNQGLKWLIVKDPEMSVEAPAVVKNMFFRLFLEKTATTPSAYDKTFAKEDASKLYHNPYGNNVYKKTFIDVTQILSDNGFARIKAQKGWESKYDKREWWHFEKRDGLTMYQALRQIYTEDQIVSGYKGLANAGTVMRMYNEGFPVNVLEKMGVTTAANVIFQNLLAAGKYQQAIQLLEIVHTGKAFILIKSVAKKGDLVKLYELTSFFTDLSLRMFIVNQYFTLEENEKKAKASVKKR